MPRRIILTERQRVALFSLPINEPTLLKYYTLADEDLEHIRQRRRPANQLGFALQLCALRYPGRLLQPGETIPEKTLAYIGAQLGFSGDVLIDYAARRQTRYQHSVRLQALYDFKSFEENDRQSICLWLESAAEQATSNEDIAIRFVEECRKHQIILPAVTTIERLCANALVEAERRIEKSIADRLSLTIRDQLSSLLKEMVDERITRFVWLRQYEIGGNSAAANRLLDRLQHLQNFLMPENIFADIPSHRISRLRRHGERYYADGMRDLSENRRLAILAVCVVEWQVLIADAVVETHDRIVGRLYRSSERLCDTHIAAEKALIKNTLKAFAELGSGLIDAQEDGVPLDATISSNPGWEGLRTLVASASKLTSTMSAEPLTHILMGYHRFRRYTPRMLEMLSLSGAPSATPLLDAVSFLKGKEAGERTVDFLRRGSKWHRHVRLQENTDHRFWEIAVLFHLRDALRAGDVWLNNSRRYGDLKQVLVPTKEVRQISRLAVPFQASVWLSDRQLRLEASLETLSQSARLGTIPGGVIEKGILQLEKLKRDIPEGADELVLDLYKRLPDVRITNILTEVDKATGFTEAFTHLRTGAPCKDRIGLMNVILADGINLGLRKMAEATTTHGFWELMRISRWHIEGVAYDQALAMVVEAQAKLPMATFWGAGITASSDGQFFSTSQGGEAMNLVNAKYGNEPGLKAYTHVSDQYAPFATQAIPATVSEAPYILDGLLMNKSGQKVREHYADTGGFTDHVFAVCSILGYAFTPRIRGLPSKRLYVFEPTRVPSNLRPMIGGKINQTLIERNWPDILRIAATIATGTIAPSQILRKLSSYPRQNELATALREVGKLERSLFMIDWILDEEKQRRTQIGLNKGEAHHALKQAISFHRRGEIRDRTSEGQHYRIAGLNLLAAIIIYWNTQKLGKAVQQRNRAGLPVSPELLAHISPLGWEHINLTGQYTWPIP